MTASQHAQWDPETDAAKCNSAILYFIIYPCAFFSLTCQNVFSGKGLGQFSALVFGTKLSCYYCRDSPVCLRMSSYCCCRVSYWLNFPDPVSRVSLCICFLNQTKWVSYHIWHTSVPVCVCTNIQTWPLALSISDKPWSGSVGSSVGAVGTFWLKENLITD